MTYKVPAITIDSILSGLDLLALKESLQDTYSNQAYTPLLRDTWAGKKFLSMSQEELDKILKASFYNTATSNTKMTQHFYGNILQAPVKLSTFLKQSTQVGETEESTFYTNYTLLNEITASPVDQNNDVLVAASDGVNLAYIKSKASPDIFIARRPALTYSSFSSKNTPQVEEGRRIREFANSNSNAIRDMAFNKLLSMSSQEEQKILTLFKADNQIYPVLLDSISFAFVDALNLLSASSRVGAAKHAANSLLGHSYLTRGAFDQDTLFSINPEVSRDLHNLLTEIVTFHPPYVNKWAPNTADFDLADKRVRSAPAAFKAMLNMFFSTFGNLYSALSKSVGRSSAEPMDLSFYSSTSSIEDKIKYTIDLMAAGKLWATQSIDKLLANSFTRLVWSFNPAGNYYSVGIDIVSINITEATDSHRITISGSSFLADKKVARLPINATTFLLHGKNYDKEEYISLYKSAGATSTVNGGNENVLRELLASQFVSLSADHIFSTTPKVIYAGIPKLFMQLSSKIPDKLLVLPIKVGDAFDGIKEKIQNDPSLKTIVSGWTKEKQNKYTYALNIIESGLKDSINTIDRIKPPGSNEDLGTFSDIIFHWLYNPSISPLLKETSEEIFIDGMPIKDENGNNKRQKVPGIFKDRVYLDKIQYIILAHIHEQLVPAEELTGNLLSQLYTPSFSMLGVDRMDHSLLLENLQFGMWAFEDSPKTFLGLVNIVTKTGNMLQLNEEVMRTRFSDFVPEV